MAKLAPFTQKRDIPQLSVEFAKNLTIEKIIREIDKYDEDVENAAREHMTFFGEAALVFQEALEEWFDEYTEKSKSLVAL